MICSSMMFHILVQLCFGNIKEELRETILVWDVIGIGEVRRRKEYFTTIQSGHLYHSKVNNGQVSLD